MILNWTVGCDIIDIDLLIEQLNFCKELNKTIMNKSACSAVICQPGGREQNHDNYKHDFQWNCRLPIIIKIDPLRWGL